MSAKRFFSIVSGEFGALNQKQVDGLNVFLANEGLSNVELAYVMATAWHETAKTMQPIKEYGSKSYFESMYDAYKGSTTARRSRAVKMGNTEPGDGCKYCGRGYVQLTWKRNYEEMGRFLDVDFVNNPDLALDPVIAKDIIIVGMTHGMFTGKKLSNYINDSGVNYLDARRVINGTDKAQLIAGYANSFREALS